MKRLIRSLGIAAAICATAFPTFAQSKDLAGSWTLDVEKSGTKEGPAGLVITLTDKEMNVTPNVPAARAGDSKAPTMTFKLDGTETEMQGGMKTKASWHGSKLEATVINPKGTGDTISFSRDGAWLVMEGNSPQHGPMKLFFKKTPAKL